MINICVQCGMNRADKLIDLTGPFAICPECGYKHKFLYMPLFIISGPSGVGKSTVCNNLVNSCRDFVLLDTDILWRDEFNKPEDNYRNFFEMWLRLSKNISQSGRPVVLFGVGFGVPDNLEVCIERRYFSEIHYLAMTISDEVISERLNKRPEWRNTRRKEYIEDHQRFSKWLMNYNMNKKHPPITLLDVSGKSIQETSDEVSIWIRKKQSGKYFD
jgi:hypothetical protein